MCCVDGDCFDEVVGYVGGDLGCIWFEGVDVF